MLLDLLFLILCLVIAVFLPPLAVLLWMARKERVSPCCAPEFILSLILSILFWVPGIIFAWIVIICEPVFDDWSCCRRTTSAPAPALAAV